MPRVTDEEGNENKPDGSSFSIATWWRKFHFSGRVIACSVLLGLGLVLIGGLIFAINITDDDSKPNDKDSASGLVPTKAPANYTGPVVMGIGGFIVVTGVIMCLFETQVCRKRTGDSSPLISEKIDDPESKSSDPAPGPSTSHGHKSRKPGAHKTSTSPRKSKSRHVKSRSKERNQQKNPSPKSPPVAIHPSKGFITSSDDNFLTPPNTLDENVTVVKKVKSGNSEAKNSSLMKSFTSSDPSWNQSAEFLTPSTSFRDTSVSLNNSVEVDENNDEKRLSVTELPEQQNLSSEYMTPLTVEEDRIQQLLIRVKNEQKQMVESKKAVNVGTSEYSTPDKESNSLQAQIEVVKKDNVVGEKTKNEKSSSDMPLPENSSTTNVVNQEPTIQMKDASSHELNQNNSGANVPERNLNVVQNEALDEITDEIINVTDEKISSQPDLTSLTNEIKETTLVPDSDKEVSHSSVQGNDEQADLDSSVSSGETVVSRDSFQENAINTGTSDGNSTLATLKENSENESKCLISESSDNNKSAVETDVDHHSNQQNFPQQDISESHDLNLSKNEDLETKAHEMENESKDEAS